MTYTIHHAGVPVGQVEFRPGGPPRQVLPFQPLSGYGALAPLVERASIALHTTALAGARRDDRAEGAAATTRATLDADAGVLARAATLGRQLELRDAAGRLVPTRFIELVAPLNPDEPVAAIIGTAEAMAPVPAPLEPPPSATVDEVEPPGA